MDMEDYAALVEPRLGTLQTRWIAFSSASRPFGMVNVSPDTRVDGDWGCGYRYDDANIAGISHLHEWQVGALLFMPTNGLIDPSSGTSAFASGFSHEDEIVKPGYHKFTLQCYNITCELTATSRVALHRYQYPTGDNKHLIIDLASTLGPSAMGEARLKQIDEKRWEGYVDNLPTVRRPRPWRVYFAIVSDTPATMTSYVKDIPNEQVTEINGNGVRAVLKFDDKHTKVELKVAISYTSIAAAWDNLKIEADGKDFDAVRADASDEWNRMLNRIQIQSTDDTRKGRFYTDLYFAILGRRTVSDCLGTYIDNTSDKAIVRQIPLDNKGKPKYRHFNSDSFWGAQWSIIPLWSLVYPEILQEFCNCFMDMYHNGGLIPRGPAGGNYTFVMTSAQTTPLFVHGILSGSCKFDDVETVYQALRKNHMPGGLMSKCGYEHKTAIGGGLQDYMTLGYIPEDLPKAGFHNNGASQTLEHAYNDWCLAQLAKHLGKDDDVALFEKRAQNYRHLFDAKIGHMRPRNRDGSWIEPYSPFDKKGWTEANGWNYTFYVPHDVPGLIDCFGSRDKFFAKLEETFVEAEKAGFIAPHGKHELSALDYGNEPALAVAHLFHVAGKPDRTNYWLRKIYQKAKCGNAPTNGYCGDEDQGIMGAWNVLVALGLFTIDGGCSGTPRLILTAPLVEKAELYARGVSKPTLVIHATENVTEGGIIRHVSLADVPMNALQIDWPEAISGATIRFS